MTTIDELAKLMYDAVPTSKPEYEQLGDVTRSVWRERAAERLGQAGLQSEEPAQKEEQPGQLGLF